jgi:hypothetical protein
MRVLLRISSREILRGCGFLLVAMLFIGITQTASAVKKTNVEQLEKLIASNKSKSDHSLADKLAELELTEQLSATRLTSDLAQLPGDESRDVLTALADIAVFEPLPKGDEVTDAAPDKAAADALFKSGQLYASTVVSKFPHFFDSRLITRYQATPFYQPRPQDKIIFEPLHKVGSSSVTILFKDGHEVIDSSSALKAGNDTETRGLSTEGEYGVILATTLADAAQGSVHWSHWEKIGGVTAAIFEYSVPQAHSHYSVTVPDGEKSKVVQPGYHGVIGMKPDGTIVRLTMIAEMGPKDLVVKANQLVDYGEVELGGTKFYCPLKSVVLTLQHMQHTGEVNYQTNGSWAIDSVNTVGPARTMVNDIQFSSYH